ncbi:tetratricopeptide repeat-containing protein [Cystoisospora suis]|uniref:Tetratricopeptide repeat-containing protein n=1 Tax=Cystoisospora suis TaxID=483139 RepID=A0A2C6KRC1_9APIC|nr:tetratricopeptide repeat-containing protein [Cystoisospora suis]
MVSDDVGPAAGQMSDPTPTSRQGPVCEQRRGSSASKTCTDCVRDTPRTAADRPWLFRRTMRDFRGLDVESMTGDFIGTVEGSLPVSYKDWCLSSVESSSRNAAHGVSKVSCTAFRQLQRMYLLTKVPLLPRLHAYNTPKSLSDRVPMYIWSAAKILDFSYNIAFNNVEEAYRALCSTASSSRSLCLEMAKMSVKTRRLGIALKCVEKLRMPKLQAALRRLAHDTDEVKLAILAAHLGLSEEVERLYRSCQRFDLLSEWLQVNSKWPSALQVSEAHARIRLARTNYAYSRYLENVGDYASAMVHLRLSCRGPHAAPRIVGSVKRLEPKPDHALCKSTALPPLPGPEGWEPARQRYESPRALRLACKMGDIEVFLEKEENPQLCGWYALSLEKEMQAALAAQKLTDSTLSRTKTSSGAANSREPSEELAASRDVQEGKPALQEALKWYTRGKIYRHQVRVLCALNKMEEAAKVCEATGDKEANLVLAQELESRGLHEKAVKFYSEAGKLRKALSLGQHDGYESDLMAAALNASHDDMVAAAAYFFERHEFEKAVALFRKAGHLENALQICLSAGLRDSLRLLAEEATPHTDPQVLEKCARVFVEMGMTDKAIRLLARTKRFDAALSLCENTARHPDVYVLAANYLQGLDGHRDTRLRSCIVTFYQKAKAFAKLAAFYIAIAQSDIEEHSAYGSAQAALKESRKYLLKCPDKAKRVELLDARLEIIDRFMRAKELQDEDPEIMVRELVALLKDPAAEKVLKRGDVFGQLARFYASVGNHKAAAMVLKKMQEQQINVYEHLDRQTLEEVCAATAISVGAGVYGATKAPGGRPRSGEARGTEEEDGDEASAESAPFSAVLEETSSPGSHVSDKEEGLELSSAESGPAELGGHDWDEDSDFQQGDKIPEDDQEISESLT